MIIAPQAAIYKSHHYRIVQYILYCTEFNLLHKSDNTCTVALYGEDKTRQSFCNVDYSTGTVLPSDAKFFLLVTRNRRLRLHNKKMMHHRLGQALKVKFFNL
jgi:hypothetical protein